MSSEGWVVNDSNVSTDALTDQFDALVESSIDPGWLARKLLKAKIVTFNEMERATDTLTRDTETQRRHFLMTSVVKKSRESAHCFKDFLNILELEPALKIYATTLQNYYSE